MNKSIYCNKKLKFNQNISRMSREPPSKSRISWKKWEEMSEKARRSDTWGHGCGHSLFQPPFSFEFVMNTNFIFVQALSCPLFDKCQAIDEWNYQKDFLYIRRYEPPIVRPVNFKNGLVLNEKGQIMGPISQQEWLVHSQKLLDIFFELIKGKTQNF